MKKTLSIIILAAMLLTSLVIMPASAEATAPTGQIWEAEYELGQLSVETMAEADINAGKFYAQDVTSYNDVAISEKPSNDRQALWKNSGAGSELKFNLDVKCSGTMTAYWQMMYSNDFGQFEVYFDDVKISGDTAIDTYAAKSARKFVEFKYENLAVTAGKHVLKFVVMGKNDARLAMPTILCFASRTTALSMPMSR